MKSLNFKPIAFFKSPHIYKYDAPRQSVEDSSDQLGVIHFEKGFNFIQALKGLQGFDRLWLIYQFHKNENWKPLTQTPRATEKQGVFATRSPYRPNPIGLSCVQLIKIENDKVYIQGFDLLDGTPILDIKPYIPECDRFDVKNESWLEEEELKEVLILEHAEHKILWLEKNNIKSLRGFIVDQLKRDPTNQIKKRVSKIEDSLFRLCYRTWRIDFIFHQEKNLCEVIDICSGYTVKDLENSSEDKYNDKATHIKFCLFFKT